MWKFRFSLASLRDRKRRRHPATPPRVSSATGLPGLPGQHSRNRAAFSLRAAGSPHPGWGYHAEEILFHTSRYYIHTERFLRQLSGVRCFAFGAYRAQDLDASRKQALARLLQRRPGRSTARALIELLDQLQTGEEHASRLWKAKITSQIPTTPWPVANAGLAQAPAEDPLLNLAERFAVPVRKRGRHLWVPFGRLLPLLDAQDPRLRTATREAIDRLHDGHWHLHKYHGENR